MKSSLLSSLWENIILFLLSEEKKKKRLEKLFTSPTESPK